MIQILALREFTVSDKDTGQPKTIKSEVWFEKGLRASSVEDIFESGLTLLEGKVPDSERFNIYYTISECLEEKGRKLLAQHHIPFDVDGISVPPVGSESSLIPLAHLVCKAIGVPFEECGVLYSGNGIQVIVGSLEPITSVDYFDKWRDHYGAICDRIDDTLEKSGVKGKADRAVWSPARLMRFPNTRNVKKNKEPRTGVVLNSKIVRTTFTVPTASGMPEIKPSDQVSTRVLNMFPTPDVKTILNECKFLQWNFNSSAEVDEPKWYAALSIVSRFPNGRELCHQMSKGHPGYSFNSVERKIDQALNPKYGPRTCKNIQALSDKCRNCKHFGTDLVSPIMIEGEDHVRTASTGFYHVTMGADGQAKRGKPDIHGLRNYFARENTYRVTESNGFVYTFNGTHYEEHSRDRILKYAEDKFDPKPLTNVRNEFYQAVKLYNLVPQNWFVQSAKGYMNFKNGVLHVKERKLNPHSPEYGFRSTLPFDYSPDAVCPTFRKFIEDVTCKRETFAKIIQEYLGYTFVNEGCYLERALLLVGDGANGKSTLVNVVRTLMGADATSNLSFRAMKSDQNRVMLDGKLVNISEENSKGAFSDTEFIKNMISGGIIQAKRVYSPPYEFHNQAKMIMLCNELPFLNDHTSGFYRKFLIMPFDAVFSEETRDVHLLSKLTLEAAGIFNWILEGYDRLQKQGRFTSDKELAQLAEDYRIEEDSSYAWFTEAITLTGQESSRASRMDIYTNYALWCDTHGIKNVHEAPQLYSTIRKILCSKLNIPKDKLEIKSNGGRFFKYIELKKEASF